MSKLATDSQIYWPDCDETNQPIAELCVGIRFHDKKLIICESVAIFILARKSKSFTFAVLKKLDEILTFKTEVKWL
jgi:hypothetical protein